MELNIYNSALSILILLITLKLSLLFRKKERNLPPGPPSLPLLGNLHQLKPPIFRTLHSLSKKYGPVFSIRFGSQLAVIVSSPSIAEECFTKNDVVLANRFNSTNTKPLTYDNTAIFTAPYGDHWRNLRRISSIEILSTQRLNSFVGIRTDETKRLIRNLARGSDGVFARVDLRSAFAELTLNTVVRMVCGKRYYGEECDGASAEEAKKFREVMDEMKEFGLGSNLGDFVPILRWFDFGGELNKINKVGEKMDVLFQGLIDEHRNQNRSTNTMIDHLLSLQESQPEYYTDQIIKGLIMAMLVAGTDTSAMTIEWAMSNLLNCPEVLEKARIELDAQIGQERLIQEGDITKLAYLQNIISETLRLHPASPLLLPHFSSDECTLGGYHVPRHTMVIVNAWAIHRDPQFWNDPDRFKPERFENWDPKSGAYTFIPFGMGRRACPGSGLAQRTVGLTLGSLIQCFEWKRVGEQEIDLSTQGRGSLMPKTVPLEAQCKARPFLSKILSESVD